MKSNHFPLLVMIIGGIFIVLASQALMDTLKGWENVMLAIGSALLAAGATGWVITTTMREPSEVNKAELIKKLGSTDKEKAQKAVKKLKQKGWLYDGSLRGAYLMEANLSGADLNRAVLQGARMQWANLEKADLSEASLQEADLSNANLCNANLEGRIKRPAVIDINSKSGALPGLHRACLRGADLREANLFRNSLREADLDHADLQGADLRGADLRGAILFGAKLRDAKIDSKTKFDETTVLPSGSKWTSDVDITRFTDPEHSDFWRSYD